MREPGALVRLRQSQIDSFRIVLVLKSLGVLCQSFFSAVSFILEMFALFCREIKCLQYLAFAHVPLEQFLVVFLVLVGQANLARRLRVAKEFLRDRCVELVFLLLDIHEAFG